MAKFRINKTKDYTVMSNTHLQEKEMSLKAKGLLTVMLALPDNWDFSVAGLVSICKENETAITSTLKELREFGYLVVKKKMPNQTTSGRIEYIYDIYEQPLKKQDTEKQGVENQGLVFQGVENQGQLNTKELNTKELNIKNNKKNNKKKADADLPFEKIFEKYTDNAETIELLREWLKVRNAKRAKTTERAVQLNIDKLDDYAEQSNMTVNEYLSEVIRRGWTAFYVINNFGGYSSKGSTAENTDKSVTDDKDLTTFGTVC